jgi:hypothetical protein
VDSARERWEGYWSVADEGYYARCVRADGSEQWYRFAEELSGERVTETRVLPLRPRLTRDVRDVRDVRRTLSYNAPRTRAGDARHMLLVSAGKGRRPILVGTSRRRSRADVKGAR